MNMLPSPEGLIIDAGRFEGLTAFAVGIQAMFDSLWIRAGWWCAKVLSPVIRSGVSGTAGDDLFMSCSTGGIVFLQVKQSAAFPRTIFSQSLHLVVKGGGAGPLFVLWFTDGFVGGIEAVMPGTRLPEATPFVSPTRRSDSWVELGHRASLGSDLTS